MLQVYMTPSYVIICQIIQICISHISSLWKNTFMFHMSCKWSVTPVYVTICQKTQICISRLSSLWNYTFIFHICCKCTWPLHMSDYINMYLTCLIIVTWHIHIAQDHVRHDWVWIDSSMWKLDTGDTYRVALVRRIDKIIGLFCKRHL